MVRHFNLVFFILCATAFSSAYPQDIPYNEIERQIQNHIRANVDTVRSGSVSCSTVLCPDVDWRVTIATSFRFTEHRQPSLRPLGVSPPLDGFRLSFESLGECTLHGDAYIDIHGPAKNIDFIIAVQQVIGVNATATVFRTQDNELELQPGSDNFSLFDAQRSPNIQIEGLSGDLTILGLEVGGATGFLVTLNPTVGVLGGVLGAISGNTAASVATKHIKTEIEQQITTMITEASRQITQEIQQHVIPEKIHSGNAAGSIASLISGLILL